MRTRLDRHAASHFRHRLQQRQAAGGTGDRFIGDAGGAGLHKIVGLIRIGRKVQIGEQDVVLAQPRALHGLGFLDLDDHFARFEHIVGRVEDLRTGGDEVLVRDARTEAGIPFESLDGQPTHVIILLVIPEDQFSRHVRTLAGIARLFDNEQMTGELRGITTAEEAMKIIVEEEGKNLFYT